MRKKNFVLIWGNQEFCSKRAKKVKKRSEFWYILHQFLKIPKNVDFACKAINSIYMSFAYFDLQVVCILWRNAYSSLLDEILLRDPPRPSRLVRAGLDKVK